jgi:PhnB protein
MRISPYLTFDGRCEEALKFYEQALGAKIVAKFPYEGSPMAQQIPADWRDKIMHARLALGEQVLMGSDAPPDRYERPQGFSISLDVATAAEAERIFAALSKDGAVRMPIQKTFWAERFGMLVDRFDIPWMVNCEKAP